MVILEIDNPFFGAPVFFVDETESTMIDAVRVASDGAVSGTVVVAGFQRAGRGRRADRQWMSRRGDGLLFTLMLDFNGLQQPLGILPLVSGLGVASFVEAYTGTDCRIKWPNDVLAGGGKVAGILCQARDSRIYIGIGINCRQERFPPLGKIAPVSLRQLGWSTVQPMDILTEVLISLKEAFDLDSPLEGIEARLYLRGRAVKVATGVPGRPDLAVGCLLGLGNDGQLLIQEEGTGCKREIYSGELVL